MALLEFILLLFFYITNSDLHEYSVQQITKEKLNDIGAKFILSKNTKSWENAEQIYKDSLRVGFGEHGEPAILTDPEEIKKNEELRREFGTSVLISDKISVNRSIPDHRVKG